MGVIYEYVFPDLRDLAINAMGTGYGEWKNFEECYKEIDYDYYCAFRVNKFKFKEVNKLETGSLVSYLYQVKGYIEKDDQTLSTEPIGEIIQTLRRGEKFRNFAKYKEMWYRLKKIITSGEVRKLFSGDSGSAINIFAVVRAFEVVEERHLKKPDEKKVTKLIKELDKDVKELLRILEERMGD